MNRGSILDMVSIFVLSKTYIVTLQPTQAPTQWVPGAQSLGIKRPERETVFPPIYIHDIGRDKFVLTFTVWKNEVSCCKYPIVEEA